MFAMMVMMATVRDSASHVDDSEVGNLADDIDGDDGVIMVIVTMMFLMVGFMLERSSSNTDFTY